MTASLCTLSDIALICGGIFGGSALLQQSPVLLMLITGLAWRFCCGTAGARCAVPAGRCHAGVRGGAEAGALAHCRDYAGGDRLNPHVYLDTFVVLGSLGSQLPSAERAAGSLSAPPAPRCCGFRSGAAGRRLSPRLRTVRAQRIINLLVGGVMWFIALQLARQGIAGW